MLGFGDRHGWRSSSIICAGWRTLTPHKGNDRITQCDKCVHGKAPTRRLHSISIAAFGSGRTRKQIKSLDAVIHTQESPPQKRFLVGCSSTLMRLAQHLTALRAWCYIVLYSASDVCLVGENPTCSVPALQGCEGLLCYVCLLYTSPSPRDKRQSRMPSSA